MFGSHLSIAGGLHNALLRAEELGHACVQIFTKSPNSWGMTKVDAVSSEKVFTKSPNSWGMTPVSQKAEPLRDQQSFTKNQQQWKCKPLDQLVIDDWHSHRTRLKFDKVVSHDSYLINLATPDDVLWRKSIDLFVEELERCALLGIPYLVTHPGAHVGSGEEVGLRRVAAALDIVHDRVGNVPVTTCLEITAGQGSSLGYKLEHLESIMQQVDEPKRLGVCLDTAHLFAAGYDFRGRKYEKFRKQIAKTVGIRNVKVLHLNDSKKPLGSRVDRHDHIGRGTIGLEGFKPIVRDPAFAKIPKILETPKDKHEDGRDWDTVNIETLRGLME